MDSKNDKDEAVEAPKEMTDEELLEAKKKAFEADPERFIDINELVVAVRKTPKRVEILIDQNASTAQLFVAQGEILYNINKTVTAREILAYQKAQQEKKIVPATGLNRHMRRGLNKINLKN